MSRESQTLIRVEKLVGGYNERKILDEISFEVYQGEILVILGTSGCGKTTLLKHLIGLLRPFSGKIYLFDRDLLSLSENETLALMRKIGVLFQNGALLNSISVEDNVAIPYEQHTDLKPELIRRLVHLKLKLVGLDNAAHLQPSELSGGMRKRAALARAIALDPPILFADEPAAGLDPVTAAALDRLLLDIRKLLGITMVVVTHELTSIKRIADRILFLENGRVAFCGSLEKALVSEVEAVRSFFNP